MREQLEHTHAADLASSHDEPAPALVVGIGASAGGLEAIERVFEQMPAKTGCAFVVVQHLSADFRSMMDEILARRTELPVRTAEDGMLVRRDTIYLNAARKHLVICGGRLQLTDKDAAHTVAHPIDLFLRSLAEDCGARAVAVVLSGTGSDGSLGVRDVHAAGGTVLVQSSDTASFDGMPVSAVETGVVDRVLSPEELPDALLELVATGVLRAEIASPPTTFEGAMATILRLLRDGYGIDFGCYKPATIVRRAQRRAELSREPSLLSFAQHLSESPEQLDLLYKDLLIGVTRFFRDAPAFDRLSREVLAELVQSTAASDEIRIWVPGCATGEEAYSIAILLREAMEAAGRSVNAKIFATDVHHDSLRIAGLGVYGENALAGVSSERRMHFFSPRDGQYQVLPEVRAMVVFAPHNVLKDAPFTNLDLVSCRNLLIYFDAQAQRKVLGIFHFGLKPHGALLLGGSETTGDLSDEFDVIDRHFKLFRKRRDSRLAPDLRFATRHGQRTPRSTSLSVPARPVSPDAALIGAYDALLEQFMPPCLLVSPQRSLIHAFGGAGRYLRVPDGRTTNDVTDMLEGDLRVAVIGALQRVYAEQTRVVYRGMRSDALGEPSAIDVTAQPLRNARTGDTLALLTLARSTDPLLPEHAPGPGAAEPTAVVHIDEASREHVAALETELKYTRENLQATIEELETSNEELQATNEELVAANEQLQSTNEELHSVNEELYTVNSEFQRKITELTELNADMDHLQASSEVHTLFVDERLCIRRFTPKIAEKFNLVPHDVGRSIEVFTHTIRRPSLFDDIRRVAETGTVLEAHVEDQTGHWFLMRILPYRRGTLPGGAVLTLTDVTQLKSAESEAKQAVVQRDRFLATLSHELRNPLAAILNAAHMLERLSLGPAAEEWQHIISEGTRHMTVLLDDLLDVARVTQDKMTVTRRRMDLRSVVAPALEAVRQRAADKALTLRTEAEVPLVVSGDAARLTQVLTNLLVNAVRYTPDGGHITLRLERSDDSALLRVRDTGIGIAPDMLTRVFEPFVQGHVPGAKGREGGMGVGLSLVRHIVTLHDGSVSAVSAGPGLGSEFVVQLPLVDGEPERISMPPSTPPRGVRVLVVEDDLHSRRGLAALLELDDIVVTEAASGEDAIPCFERGMPEVVLLDLGLPGIDGLETCRRLRALPQGRHAKIFALTGFGQDSDREATQQAGFDGHLTKPVELDALYALVASARKGAPH